MSLAEELAAWMHGRVVVLAAGNPLRGDDAAGCLLARTLREAGALDVIDAEDTPENFIGAVAARRPDAVLLVDAVDLGAEPGAAALLEPAAIAGYLPSTHRVPAGMLLELLERATGASCRLLGIQPASLTLGSPPSAEVVETVDMLADLLAGLLPPQVTDPGLEHTAERTRCQ